MSMDASARQSILDWGILGGLTYPSSPTQTIDISSIDTTEAFGSDTVSHIIHIPSIVPDEGIGNLTIIGPQVFTVPSGYGIPTREAFGKITFTGGENASRIVLYEGQEPLYGSVPDSSSLNFLPTILEIPDIEKDSKYFDNEGLAKPAFLNLIKNIAKQYPTTWGHLKWDNAFWDIGGPNFSAYSTIPLMFDAATPASDKAESGVGDGADLIVQKPDVLTGPRFFYYTITMRGTQEVITDKYFPVKFYFKIYGTGTKEIYDTQLHTVWVTLEIRTKEPNNTIYALSFPLQAQSDATANEPAGTGFAYKYLPLFPTPDRFNTEMNYPIYSMTDGSIRTIGMPAATIDSIVLRQGRWTPETGYDIAYHISDDNYELWFSNDNTSVFKYDTVQPLLLANDGTSAAGIPNAILVMKSKLIPAPITETWRSEEFSYNITLNSGSPYSANNSYLFALPQIDWDPNVVEGTRAYTIEALPNLEDNTYEYTVYNTDDDSTTKLGLSFFSFNGSNAWSVDNTITTNISSPQDVYFTMGISGGYPIPSTSISLSEYKTIRIFAGTVDENGPWRYGKKSYANNVNYLLNEISLTRTDFGMPTDGTFTPTWVGVTNVTDPDIIVWLDSNSVSPFSAIREYDDPITGRRHFSPIRVYAKLRDTISNEWNPLVHSGTFFEKGDEYFSFAYEISDTVFGSSKTLFLTQPPHLGSPIIAKTVEDTPRFLRQVAFVNDSTSEPSYQGVNVQRLQGNGTSSLFVAYNNIYDIEVWDEGYDLIATTDWSGQIRLNLVSASSSTNEVQLLTDVTDTAKLYKVIYRVYDSFWVEHNVESGPGTQMCHISFDRSPAEMGVSAYDVYYENSIYNPYYRSTLKLNPIYTTLPEGYIYISHDEFSLDTVLIYLSSNDLVADGRDYIAVYVRSVDKYSNPKPNQTFNVTTTFGTLSAASITTSDEGFASFILTASDTFTVPAGSFRVWNSDVDRTFNYGVKRKPSDRYALHAAPALEFLPANGEARNVVYGVVQGPDFTPIPYAVVEWHKGQMLETVLSDTPYGGAVYQDDTPYIADINTLSGKVRADAQGFFNIIFQSATINNSGFWFVALNSSSQATPSGSFTATGDTVFWYEYADPGYVMSHVFGVPPFLAQDSITNNKLVDWYQWASYPISSDEYADPPPATPSAVTWDPPSWYPFRRYTKYQLGLLGATPSTQDEPFFNGDL